MFGVLIGDSGRGSGTVDARAEGKWAYPLPSFGVRGYYPREICEDMVHFGVKNKHFKQKHSNVHQLLTIVNYHIPQTSANYHVLDMIGDQCKRKCTTRCLI